MGAAERLADDIAYLTTPEFADACRTEDRFFTRERLLTCGVLVTSMLCSRGLSSQAEAFGLAPGGAPPPVSRQVLTSL